MAQLQRNLMYCNTLTHWGRVTHICVNNLTIIVSDNGLSPNRRQVITRTNDGILLIGSLGTNFSEILIKINTFSLKKMHLKTSSAKRRPFFSRPICVLIKTIHIWHLNIATTIVNVWLSVTAPSYIFNIYIEKNFERFFLLQQFFHCDYDFTEICSWGPNIQ